MIKNSGEKRVYANGFQRDAQKGKGRFDLLPWGAIWELAKCCEEGADVYGERNIDKGAPQSSLIDSAFRHLAKYVMGHTDEDHLRAAFWNIGWALQQNVYRKDMLNIPPMEVFQPRCVETTCLWNTDCECELKEEHPENCKCYVED